jgi:FAD/FMN-containing dehydrogenase
MQIYPNQNMCALLNTIPPALQNLDYVMYPNCDIYNTNRFNYNKRFNLFPTAIIVPQNQADLQYVFQILKENNLPFAVRSAGHCYGPGSLSSGYIIDLRNFNEITPNTGNNTVTIGAGCHLGDVISALGAINYAIPTGTCPSVGVGGLALGGGVGLLARAYGLTTDSIISMTVLMADGTIVDVTQDTYPDLFWALRGAGANAFGIVLDFTFNMYYIPTVSLLNLTWTWNPSQAAQIAEAWQNWFPAQSTDITSELIFYYNNGQVTVKINALKIGDAPFTEWQSAFASFNPTVNLYQGTYLEAANLFASNYTQPFSKVKSKFIFSPLSSAGITQMVQFMNQLVNNPCPYIFFLELGGASGGAIAQGDSAYYPRSAYAWIFQFIYWPFEFQQEGALNLIRQFYRSFEQYTSPYSYANLVDYDLGASYLNAYYGSNVNRLIQIKNIYDPTNIFTWRQGIPTTYVPQSTLNQAIQRKYCS